jgi:hypothetical protein
MDSLTNWLTASDGALIAYPFALNRQHVAALLARNLAPLPIQIVSDNEIGGISTLQYSDFAGINSALHNSDLSGVIFDSAPMLAMIAPALNFQNLETTVLVLTTWGDAPKYLDIITQSLPAAGLLSLDILNDNNPIQWKLVSIPMSQDQLPYYDTVRRAETTGTLSARNQPYPATRMVTLYHYPFDDTVDLTGTVCTAELPPHPDLLDHPDTWMSVGYLPTLENDGPKLAALMDAVASHWPQKQIIVTQFTHRYGVHLIASFLRLASQDRKSPYQETGVFPVQCSDDYEAYRANFVAFDSADTGILITNVVPPIPLHHVEVVHVVDSYAYTPLILTLHRVHQRHITTGGLTVYLYVATHPHEVSSDQTLVGSFGVQVHQADANFARLVQGANKIVFTPTKGLVVQE